MGNYSDKVQSHNTIKCVYRKKNFEKFKKLWTNDEEFYNITGYFYNGSEMQIDPLNCNMYEVCKQCERHSSRDEVI